jgi:hypothetical protein
MDAAMAHQKKEEDFMMRLLKIAQPMMQQQQPEFMQPPPILEEYDGYAINLTDYALKYIGCSNIHTYSDDLVADEDLTTVLEM